MRVLLDTSVFLKIGIADQTLDSKLHEALSAAEQMFVSPISRTEIAIKVSTGKISLSDSEERFWSNIVTRLQATELPYTCSQAAQLSSLPLIHKDPFDRMIAAQCLAEDLHLATTDRVFAAYGVKLVT